LVVKFVWIAVSLVSFGAASFFQLVCSYSLPNMWDNGPSQHVTSCNSHSISNEDP